MDWGGIDPLCAIQNTSSFPPVVHCGSRHNAELTVATNSRLNPETVVLQPATPVLTWDTRWRVLGVMRLGGTWAGLGRDLGGTWAGPGRDLGGTWAGLTMSCSCTYLDCVVPSAPSGRGTRHEVGRVWAGPGRNLGGSGRDLTMSCSSTYLDSVVPSAPSGRGAGHEVVGHAEVGAERVPHQHRVIALPPNQQEPGTLQGETRREQVSRCCRVGSRALLENQQEPGTLHREKELRNQQNQQEPGALQGKNREQVSRR